MGQSLGLPTELRSFGTRETQWVAKPAGQPLGPNPNIIEDEYITNLQQQIYFMELELKLLKQKQDEEEKSGGVAGLFVDEKTAAQHLGQLKEKYQRMRRELDKHLAELSKQKTDIQGQAQVLNYELGTLSQQSQRLKETNSELTAHAEQDVGKLEADLGRKGRERAQLETQAEAVGQSLADEQNRNTALKNQEQIEADTISRGQKARRNRIGHQEKMIAKLRQDLEMLGKDMEERKQGVDKNVELQKVKRQNEAAKASIFEKEKALCREQVRVTQLEHLTKLNAQIKEDEINERRMLLSKNEELKREIDAKDQLNNLKIQKKLKDKSAGQLRELTLACEENQKSMEQEKAKIAEEQRKVDTLETELITSSPI